MSTESEAEGMLATQPVTQYLTIQRTGCPTRYRTRHFFNNFPVSQQLGALQTHPYLFPTQRTYCCSNFVAISSLVLELLKKCRVR